MKIYLKKTSFYFLLLGLTLLSACSSYQKNTNRNVSGIYMPGINLINPEFKVFHKNDTLTEFHFRLNSENILYTKRRDDSTFSSNILINYQLTDPSLKSFIDSTSISFTDYGNNKEKKYLEGKINLPTELSKSYTLSITFADLNRDHHIKKQVTLNRIDVNDEQHFLILDTLSNIIFKNHFNDNEHVLVKKSESVNDTNIIVKYYKSEYPVAKPPFSTSSSTQNVPFSPEFTNTLTFDSLNTIRYVINKKGLYHFELGSNKTGPTLFNFQENFPEIKSLENMIGPIRYISTTKEFNFLKENENKKEAIDKFWQNIAGSNDRARTLIREYYNRVESSNNYFTSYLEGWKTDRGIIYIIYGSPSVVYKNKNYENWIYGEENNIMSISFIFRRVENPISNNDFSLERSSVFKNSWFRAVDSWRSGRIY